MSAQGEKDQPLPSTLQTAYKLRILILYSLITSFGGSVSAPSVPYIYMNFFAQRHTGLGPDQIHCETSTMSVYCQQAIFDGSRLIVAMSIVCPVVQFMVMPVMGVLSDSIGRWKVMVAFNIYGFLPSVALMSFLLFNTSMYWSIAFSVLTTNPVTALSVYMVLIGSMVSDLEEQPAARSVAFGLMEAAATMGGLLGTVFGAFFSLTQTVYISFGFQCIGLLYALLLLSESLPPERRLGHFTWHSLLPGVELRILWRTPALKLLAFLIVGSTAVGEGFQKIFPMLVQLEMNFTSRHAYYLAIIGGISKIITMTLLLRPIIVLLGEVGAIFLGSGISLVMAVLVGFLVRSPWQVLLVFFCLSGIAGLPHPVVVGLKSALVGPEDQGNIQGALVTVINIAASIGLFAFTWIFNATNHAPDGALITQVNKTAFVVGALIGVPFLCLVFLLPSRLKAEGYRGVAGLAGSPESAPDATAAPAAEGLALVQAKGLCRSDGGESGRAGGYGGAA